MTPTPQWPELPFADWSATRATLHMWVQIVGKVKLALSPFQNHWWEVALRLDARGLRTGNIPWGDSSFEIQFDFVNHRLEVMVSDGRSGQVALEPRSVADFHRAFVATLAQLGIDVDISMAPSEVGSGIPFDQDTVHAAYDGDLVRRWWQIMLGVERAIEQWRVDFRGKTSPVLFYWGGFDLNHTRFNGTARTPPAEGGVIAAYGEDEENFAVGFWSGADTFPHPVLYAYLTPAPEGIADARVLPEGARFEPALQEFVLRYDEARRADSPQRAMEQFFESTYRACTDRGGWDRAGFAAHVPELGSTRAR